MAATLHAGIIPGAEAKKLYSYPTLPANSEKMLLGNGTWGSVYHHPTPIPSALAPLTLNTEVYQGGDEEVPHNATITFNQPITLIFPWGSFSEEGHLGATGANEVTIVHPTVAAATGKPTANATPAFGSKVTVSAVSRDSLGHVSAITDRTITIPNSAASSTAAGLMSANDKKNHDSLVSMFNGQWTTSIDASGCMVVKAANGATVFKIDKAGEW